MRRVFIAITCSWIVSISFPLIEIIKCYNHTIKIALLRYLSYILFGSITVGLSIYTLSKRNMHLQAINKQNNMFETEKEKNNFLRFLRTSISDTFKLNMFSSVLNLIHIILSTYLELFLMNNIIYKIVFCLYAIHMISNPVVFIVMITPLKQQYRALLCKCNSNQYVNPTTINIEIEPVSTSTVTETVKPTHVETIILETLKPNVSTITETS